ncbi:MAG: ATP-binding cassette domain-containing protein [Parasporobacterium sp.]|nr:ATP-binding cassette domain-containing protein [Parasporobacterium sp.]
MDDKRILLEAKDLKKYFKTPMGYLHAVDGVSFTIEEGTTLGIVGESGCGKSTLGRALIGLNEPTGGQVIFNGNDITHVSKKRRKQLFTDMQMIFQDPFSSLDPRMCVADLIGEPLDVYRAYTSKTDREKKIAELMDTVGLARRVAYAFPHQLDGGRRQRIGVARALALDPKLVVCDEPVSALDVSIQAQILNLLKQLQKDIGLTYVFITHDLSVVKHISHKILIMYMGCLVEMCETEEFFRNPTHPYSKGLLSAIPIPSIHVERNRIHMDGEITSPIEPAPGCRFAPRCRSTCSKCFSVTPELKEISPGHFCACHMNEN